MAWPNGPEATDKPEEKKQLTAWTVSTYYKKSIEEHEHFTKDGMEVIHKIGWRGGSWTVYTNDGKPPVFEFVETPGGNGALDSIDIYNCYGNNIEEVELNETWDGCWDDVEWSDNIEEDEQERLQELADEEGWYALEEEGWSLDSETYIWGPILIEGDNNFRLIIEADQDGNVIELKDIE